MPDASDMELLRDYARHGSEAAFTELVRRHVNLVYSAALRQAGIAAHAEEITQAVFVILARKAAQLRPDIILDGWFYQTTRLTALSFLRGERRRQWREQEAFMQSTLHSSGESPNWNQLAPLLDEAMARLGKTDREAVVLRYFRGKSLDEVAMAMKTTQAAAQSRVHRAVAKLQKYFLRRGIDSTTAAIAGAISANSIQAVPVALTTSITAVALAKGAAAPISTLNVVKGALNIMAWTKAKTAVIAVVTVIVATGATTLAVHQQRFHPQPRVTATPQLISPAETDFPRASWAFAGYADPRSALLSAIWSLSAGDFDRFMGSLTPGERGRQLQQLKDGAQRAGKSVPEFFATIGTRGNMPNTTGFRVLDQQMVSDNQMILRVNIQGTAPGKEGQVVDAKMIKTGNEWKVDSFGPN